MHATHGDNACCVVVRRRTEHRFGGTQRDVSDETFLDWLNERLPLRRADVTLVQRALSTPLPRRTFRVLVTRSTAGWSTTF